ncbi:MAG: DUF2306 domain-containing protein [Chitinophagaceae bacterium]
MAKKGLWILFGLLSVVVGLYPTIYLFAERKFGILESKSTELLANILWNVGFYMHISFGGIALLIGWTQFISKIRIYKPKIHTQIGKIYVVSVLLSSITGIFIGFFATGGLVASLGFICLSTTWLYTTVMGYISIRNQKIYEHQKMMVYSYAACFAAVTLRIWLPILTIYFGNFVTAYRIVAWLSWVPNLIVAYLFTRLFIKHELPAPG